MNLKVDELEQNICCIYKINYPNGKIYIGSTTDLKRRMQEHNRNTHKKLPPCDAAIKKYTGPVLIVHGDADEAVPVEYGIEASKEAG